ncbi:MAG TPA: hypothetical protein VIW70_16625 [Rubrivivax sp.]
MSRALSVAGSLAILILAFWIVQAAKLTTPLFAAVTHTADASAVAAPEADITAAAVDDLAAWPIAAGR